MAGENPVTFEEGQKVVLRLTLHEDGQSFGVPIQADGSFDIGWMPIGKYSAVLEYDKSTNNRRGPAQQSVRHSVPGGFEVIEEKTEYTIDLGKNFKQ